VQLRRSVIGVRGDVNRGNSGGPIVDERGRVIATVFAKRAGTPDQAYALPNDKIRSALANIGPPLQTACVER
jgi:S1-C subfamily serine protease